MKKPDSCIGCPLFDDGQGFVPDEIVPGADVFIVMQNPGENEEEVGRPAVGASGEYLNTHFLPLAGLSRETVSVGNVLKCRWRDPKKGTKTNDLPSKTGVWNEGKKKWDKALGNKVEKLAMAQCMSAHLRVPKHIKLIVTLGEVPAKAIAKVESVTEWRGHLAEMQYENVPVFLSYHPSYLLQSPRMSIPAMIDWKRIKLFLDGKFPEPVPQRTVIGKDQADSIIKLTAIPGTVYVTYDLEWDVETKAPFLAGIAFFNEQGDVIGGVQVWTQEVDQADLRSWLLWLFWRFPMVMHNAAADLEITKRAWDIGCEHFCEIHDTIQLHAVSHSEWPHDLGFCESLYGRHIRLKGKSKENVLLYNWGDCITTGYTFHQLRQIAKTDPISFKVYQTENLPVIPIRVESKIEGIRLDTQFLSRMSDDLARRAIAAQNIAEMYAGIHVGSPLQVSTYLTKVEKMKLPKSRATGNESVDKDVIADLRREFLDYDPEEEKDGIDESQLLHNIMAGGHPILEARACYANAYNLRSHYITTLLRKGVPSGREHYDPDEFVSRCYPDQHTHPQSSGRWSTVEPPLPTLKKKLRKMVIPDVGMAMCGFDFDQQELRIDAHVSDDQPTIEVFERGHDIHTVNTCDIFVIDYPVDMGDPHKSPLNDEWRLKYGWDGKDDRRRVFSKRFVYRVRYRGNPAFAGDIPGAKVLQLRPKDLVDASRAYLSKHVNLVKHWRIIDANVLRTRTSRTPVGTWHGMPVGGRKRYLNGYGVKSRAGEVAPICRENTNHPFQGFGADALYVSIQVLYKETQHLHAKWGYGAHDSQKWFMPAEVVSSWQSRVAELMNEPWIVMDRKLRLPIEFDKPTYAPEELHYGAG